MQTVGHAVEPDDQELQACAARHQAAARRVADRAGARGHVPQPRDFLRPRRQVHAHREHHAVSTCTARNRTTPNATIVAQCIATTFVLLDKPAAAEAWRHAGAAAGGEAGRLAMNATLLLLVLMQAPRRTRRRRPRRPRQADGPGCRPQPQTPPPAPPDRYTYTPDGRRDPFLSLLGTGAEHSGPQAKRGDGVAGMTVAEISVRGILQSRGTLIAMVQGPDNRTYMSRQGDQARRWRGARGDHRRAGHHAGSQRSTFARQAADGSQTVAIAGGRQAVTVTRGFALVLTLAVAGVVGGQARHRGRHACGAERQTENHQRACGRAVARRSSSRRASRCPY